MSQMGRKVAQIEYVGIQWTVYCIFWINSASQWMQALVCRWLLLLKHASMTCCGPAEDESARSNTYTVIASSGRKRDTFVLVSLC